MRILVIEDDRGLASAVKDLLQRENYDVDWVDTAYEGIDRAMTNAYDCLISDVMLPDGNGVQIVEELRSLGFQAPILLLTVRNELRDRVTGLNAGADDYLGKPFDAPELIARVQALIRRSSSQRDLETMEYGQLKLHQTSRTLTYQNHVLELSSKEFMLLAYFIRNPKQVLTRDQLVAHVWGPDMEVADNALDTYIYFLRKKCVRIGIKSIIRTIRGEGYMLSAPDEA